AQCGGGGNLARSRGKVGGGTRGPGFSRFFTRFVGPWGVAGPGLSRGGRRGGGGGPPTTRSPPPGAPGGGLRFVITGAARRRAVVDVVGDPGGELDGGYELTLRLE